MVVLMSSSQDSKNNQGFTLVELSIVMVIFGVMLTALLESYSSYLDTRRFTESMEKQRDISATISRFINISFENVTPGDGARLPCPADPTLLPEDPNFGVENCSLMTDGSPIGTCIPSGGICKVAGNRDTEADTDLDLDPVLIGGVPFVTLRNRFVAKSDENEALSIVSRDAIVRLDDASFESIIDPWGYQMTYAVSGHLTQTTSSSAPFANQFGSLQIITEFGEHLTTPDNSGHYVLIAHGPNSAGANSTSGRVDIPCLAGATEGENCDGDAQFIQGLRNETNTANYFDDTVLFSSFTTSGLWENVEDSASDIYNLNLGNVGVGTATPVEKLHVEGRLKAVNVSLGQICDEDGENCWSASNLGGDVNAAAPAGTQCAGVVSGSNVEVVQAIARGEVVCTTVPLLSISTGQTCVNPDTFMIGIRSDGTIICSDDL